MPGAGETGNSNERAQELEKHWEHLVAALHALQTTLEAQPRLSAIMASTAALAPICNCIEPICRHARPDLSLSSFARTRLLVIRPDLPLPGSARARLLLLHPLLERLSLNLA